MSQPLLSTHIPAALRHCRERPAVGKIASQADAASFLVQVIEAGQDCRRKLQGLDGAIRDVDAARAKR